jgi:aspartate carbamoyltransferase catalytic subunit
MEWKRKDLLGLEDMSREEITHILDTAENFKEVSQRDIKKVPPLRGKTVLYCFFEPSTRTRVSFEIAGKRLSADTVNISSSGTSLVKGESLVDTARNLEAMYPDIVVIRHQASGVPHMLASFLRCPVINAGDGTHEHPSQGLLDMLTIRNHKEGFEGLKVLIIGDVKHSRVARSNIFGLTTMGARVYLAGPLSLIPPFIEDLGVVTASNIAEAVEDADVIMVLRIQQERMERSFFPNIREYSRYFGLTEEHVKRAKPDVIIMHPGPINRGVEISTAVADGPYSVILEQVSNGVAVRMALLYIFGGGGKYDA